MKSLLTLLAGLLLMATAANAESQCTLEGAQKLMLQVNNMTQKLSRESIAYVERNEEPPADLQQKILQQAEESAAIGIRLGKASEGSDITRTTPIETSICNDYQSMLRKYMPAGQEPAPVALEATTTDPSCNSETIWTRWAEALKKQNELLAAGKIKQDDMPRYMKLASEFGEYSTTDMTKACVRLVEIEKLLGIVKSP